MDNLTHSVVGAVLAEAGPRDRWALAAPTLIIAANVPDVDAIAYLVGDPYIAVAWRRGITHGIPALVVWPFVVAAAMLAWDRWVRRRREPAAQAARFGPLLGLAALGAITHPILDWLNTYGMRWWLPFDGAWSYGDAVFIIDPWLWLGLGGTVFLARSTAPGAVAAWAALAALASVLVLAVDMVPPGAKAVWIAGVLVFAGIRWRRPFRDNAARRRRFARVATAGATAYILAMTGAAVLAERQALTDVLATGLEPVEVMTGPRPARLAERDVIVATTEDYRVGRWHWRGEPRLVLEEVVPRRHGPDHIIDQGLRHPQARHFLVWARYPWVHAHEEAGGWVVRLGDVRYPDRGPAAPEIRVGE